MVELKNPARHRRRSREEWSGLVLELNRSLVPVRKFCAERGISTGALYKWRHRLQIPRDFGNESAPVVKRDNTVEVAASRRIFAEPSIKAEAFIPLEILDADKTFIPNQSSELPSTPLTSAPRPLITSRFIIHGSGCIKIEFPCGCTGSELRLVSDVLSC